MRRSTLSKLQYLTISNNSLDERRRIRMRYVNNKILLDWVVGLQFFEAIFSEATHDEVIKQSKDVFVFLASQGDRQIGRKELDKMWAFQGNKHETVQEAVFEVIQQISRHVKKKHVNHIYKKICKIRPKDINEKTVKMIQRFSQQALHVCLDENKSGFMSFFGMQSSKKKVLKSAQQYGVEIFWDLIQDGSGLPPKHYQLVFDTLKRMLTKIDLFAQFKEAFLKKCIENV
jgi:hypothetical protein